MIAAPLFHAWGFAHFTLGMALSSTLVLKRKFDPEATLSLTAQHECTALVVVPVMLQRILALDDEVLDRYDLSALRSSPSPAPRCPARSPSAGWTCSARTSTTSTARRRSRGRRSPRREDLRAAPGTAGQPPRGTIVRLYDDDGKPIEEPATTGRIFVGNDLQMEGYTGGGGKDVIDGLMSSGDVGHFDEEGRLFIDGRDDDMIVSGGENVFPQEVEELLAAPRRGRGGRGLRRRRREVRPAPEGGRRQAKGKKLAEKEVKDHVKTNLAGYKVPRDVEFIDELPRNATGKVLKRELKEDARR